ncbi:MAG: hypothetical protein M3Y87_22745, partial [Myxococcota bacterium]|nr:hypothetical protein [Myxococcota bacterium]
AILAAAASGGSAIPLSWPAPETAVPPRGSLDEWWAAMNDAYRAGQLRDDDLVLDPTYAPLRERFDLGDLLRIRREF